MNNEELARRYALFKAADFGTLVYNLGKYTEGEVIVDEVGFTYGDLDLSMSKETALELIKQYDSLFPEKVSNRVWYNVDGKTSTLAKLIKKLKLEKSIAVEYARLSRDIHANTSSVLVKAILTDRRYINITEPSVIRNIAERISLMLIETYKVVANHYMMPIHEFTYSEPDPALMEMIERMYKEALEEAKVN